MAKKLAAPVQTEAQRKELQAIKAFKSLGPCPHLGERLPNQPCGLSLKRCGHFGDITTELLPCKDAQRCCRTCPEHPAKKDAWPIRYDKSNLWPSHPGERFNPSIIDDPATGGYIFAYRSGWKGSEVYLGRMDAQFKPVGQPTRLHMRHRECGYGREDPRLFRFKGKLHVAFIGVVGPRKILHTSQLYARISDDFKVERVFYPHYPQRNSWEKNWQFFEHDGVLYAGYSIAPHRVLRIDGDRAEMVYQEPTRAGWSGGEMRGGAAPVRVGDEYWCFFHDRIVVGGVRVYRGGLYTFEAQPPFRPLRIIPEPILNADIRTKPKDQYAAVVFPCGAVRTPDDRWVLSAGIHDRKTALFQFDHAELERRLKPIGLAEVQPVTNPVSIAQEESGSAQLGPVGASWGQLRRAFVVVGPESSGNKHLTATLTAAGCAGQAPTDGPQPFDGPGHAFVLPEVLPQQLAVMRSFPHGNQWPDLAAMVTTLREKEYTVTVLVMVRDGYAVERSHLGTGGHADSVEQSRGYVREAYRRIFAGLQAVDAEFLLVPYTSLGRAKYRRWLGERLGLDLSRGPEFRDGDAKYLAA